MDNIEKLILAIKYNVPLLEFVPNSLFEKKAFSIKNNFIFFVYDDKESKVNLTIEIEEVLREVRVSFKFDIPKDKDKNELIEFMDKKIMPQTDKIIRRVSDDFIRENINVTVQKYYHFTYDYCIFG